MPIKTLRILAYSDIHYHEYKNGILLQDVANIEAEIYAAALVHRPDIILFGGDRYLSRNEMSSAVYESDRQLSRLNSLNVPIFMLIGNHDSATKSAFSQHSLRHIALYPNDLKNIVVMDECREYRKSVNGLNVGIHAIPAGQEVVLPKFVFEEYTDFNICVFHAIIKGCLYQNGMPAEDGLSFSPFNRKEFDVVLGGDNHKHQEIKGFTETVGAYIGAPLEHNWGDEGDLRGYIIVTITKDDTGVTSRQIDHFESKHPKFKKCTVNISTTDDLVDVISNNKHNWDGNIVRLTISGPTNILDSILVDKWEEKIKHAVSARSIKLKLEYNAQPLVPILRDRPSTDAEEWHDFLVTKTAELDGLDIDTIEKLGLEIIGNA